MDAPELKGDDRRKGTGMEITTESAFLIYLSYFSVLMFPRDSISPRDPPESVGGLSSI